MKAVNVVFRWLSVLLLVGLFSGCGGGGGGTQSGTVEVRGSGDFVETVKWKSDAGSSTTLPNGVSVELPALHGSAVATEIVMKGIDAGTRYEGAGFQAAADAVALEFDPALASGLDNATRLAAMPQITIPAKLFSHIPKETAAVFRVADMIVDGERVRRAVWNLPVNFDGDGNIVVKDFYFPLSLESSRLFHAAAGRSDKGFNPGRIVYVVDTFANSADWSTEPRMVRFVADPDDERGRIPYSQLSGSEKDDEDDKNITNIIVLVHGHSEYEKLGVMAQSTADSPWNIAYKEKVWRSFYRYFSKVRPEDGCTVFYEFIYPTYRPIVTPTADAYMNIVQPLDRAFAGALDDIVRRWGGNGVENLRLDIVAHSMGGLVTRAGLQRVSEKTAEALEHVVTWGSPHLGSPLVSLRYVMGAPAGVYRFKPGLVSGTVDFFYRSGASYVSSRVQIDSPGTRDLRWVADLSDEGLGGRRWDTDFDFWYLRDLWGADDRYDLTNGTYLFNVNLARLNAKDRFANGDEYTALFGVTSKSAYEGYIGEGAFLIRRLMQDGSDPYYGDAAVNASDGASPVVSMAGDGVIAHRVYVGDVDHEEYYGDPQKAEKVADRTLKILALPMCCKEGEYVIDGKCQKVDSDYPAAEWVHTASLETLIDRFCPRPDLGADVRKYTLSNEEMGETYEYYATDDGFRIIGPYITRSASGTTLECWKNNGVTDEFFIGTDGVQKETHYLDDGMTENGPQRTWSGSGVLLSEIYYRNGVLDGPSRYWYENGQLWTVIYYQNGQGISCKSFTENGQEESCTVGT